MCVSLGATRFLGAEASDTMAGEEVAAAGLQALPPLFLKFCLHIGAGITEIRNIHFGKC